MVYFVSLGFPYYGWAVGARPFIFLVCELALCEVDPLLGAPSMVRFKIMSLYSFWGS